jgi:hypothetical protein
VQVNPWPVSPFPVPCPLRVFHHPVSSPRHLERNVRISRIALSCCLRLKVYGTCRIRQCFQVWFVYELFPTPPVPADSAFPLTYISRFRSYGLMGGFLRPPPPPSFAGRFINSRVTSLHGNYSASQLFLTRPTPSCLRPISRFSVIRPTLFQVFLPGARRVSPVAWYVLVLMPWLSTPPVCSSALAIWPLFHVAFIPRRRIRPLGLLFSGPPMPSFSLRPDDSLTIPKMALSMGFRQSVSLLPAIQANGLWLLPIQVCLLLYTPAFSGRAVVDKPF